jgi:hypothetical protein
MLLAWPPGPDSDLIYRGTRPAGEPFRYNHVCLAAGITRGRMHDPELPGPGEVFYYLATADSTCGAALPGHASDGTPRPGGEACLRVRLAGPPPGASTVWTLRPGGGPGRTLRLDLILDPPATAGDLYAVAFELVFDPARLSLLGTPQAGDLLAEDGAPLRVDVQGETGPGRVRITVARTGVAGVLAAGHGAGALVASRWLVTGDGPLEVRLQAVQALDSSYAPLALPAPGAAFRVQVD